MNAIRTREKIKLCHEVAELDHRQEESAAEGPLEEGSPSHG